MLKSLTFRILPLALVLCLLSACASKKDQFAGVDGDHDFVSGVPLGDRNEGANFLGGNVDRSVFEPVYFQFDSYAVSGNELSKVQAVASALRTDSTEVIIAGFTDERGTAEYNRGLGERRAQAVREALIREGISPGRLQTVSFGAEMPADPGSNESAWSSNRRAEFGVVR